MQRDPQRGRNQSSDAERHAKTLAAGKQGKIVERHAAQDAKVNRSGSRKLAGRLEITLLVMDLARSVEQQIDVR